MLQCNEKRKVVSPERNSLKLSVNFGMMNLMHIIILQYIYIFSENFKVIR
jgi:hypothetical protein